MGNSVFEKERAVQALRVIENYLIILSNRLENKTFSNKRKDQIISMFEGVKLEYHLTKFFERILNENFVTDLIETDNGKWTLEEWFFEGGCNSVIRKKFQTEIVAHSPYYGVSLEQDYHYENCEKYFKKLHKLLNKKDRGGTATFDVTGLNNFLEYLSVYISRVDNGLEALPTEEKEKIKTQEFLKSFVKIFDEVYCDVKYTKKGREAIEFESIEKPEKTAQVFLKIRDRLINQLTDNFDKVVLGKDFSDEYGHDWYYLNTGIGTFYISISPIFDCEVILGYEIDSDEKTILSIRNLKSDKIINTDDLLRKLDLDLIAEAIKIIKKQQEEKKESNEDSFIDSL
jgi:hypothetical protein